MAQMNLSNTLWNDDSSGTIALVEQLKDRLLYKYIETNPNYSTTDKNRIPAELKEEAGVFQEKLNEFFLDHWVDFQRFLLDEGVDPETIDSWKEVQEFLEGLPDDETMWLKNKLAALDTAIAGIDQDGIGIFDVSAYNNIGGTYATYNGLSAALAAIPTASKRSGMTIRYIDSTSNQYEEYRYILQYEDTTAGNAAFNNTANWQGIDAEPTAGSDNLVKSGGVLDKIGEYSANIFNLGNFLRGIYINNDNKIEYNQNYCLSDKIQVSENDSIKWYYGAATNFTMRMVLYGSDGVELDNWTNNGPNQRIVTISQSGYIRISFPYGNIDVVYVSVNSNKVYIPTIAMSEIDTLKTEVKTEVVNLNNNKVENLIFKGNGSIYVSKKFYGLIPNNRYRLSVKSTQWQHTAAATGVFILGVESYLNGSDVDVVVVRQGETVSSYYEFEAVENDYVEIGVRADIGESVIMELTNTTLAYTNAQAILANSAQVVNLNNNKVENLIFNGNGSNYVYKRFYGFIPNNHYRLLVKSTQWQHTLAPSGVFILGVESYLNSTKNNLVVVRQGETVLPYYEFVAISNDYVDVGIRADVGESVILEIVNTTAAYENAQNILTQRTLFNYYKFTLPGNNYTYVSETKSILKGKYIVLFGGTWGKTSIGTIGALFAIESQTKTYIRCNVNNLSDFQNYYFIEFTEDISIKAGARADVGTEAIIYLVNVDYLFQYLTHNYYVTEFDKVEGKEFLFLGKSFVQADAASSGGIETTNNNRVSLASLLEIPYPKAKLKFKLPNHIVAKMIFGDFSYQLNTKIAWICNGQTIEVPEKVLYYRLTFARTTVIQTTIGDSLIGVQPISVAEVLSYINKGEISIIFDNVSVFSTNALQEQYLKTCMRKYTTSYSSDRDKGFNYYPTILHLTDVHGDVTRIRRALQYAKMLNIETVVLTGDIVCGDTRNDATFIKDIEDETGISIYPCVGNHDTYGTSIFDNGGEIGVNPAYRQWNTITKNVLTKEGVVSPAGVDYPTYYHYDDSTRKLRYIFVNLYEKGRDYTYSGALYVSSAQINWLISTLATTPQDYGVILLMHQAETGITKDNNYAKFYGVEAFTPQSKISGTPIRKIVDAFIGKTSISDSYTQYVNGIDGEQETIQYTADFSSVASGVEFIAYLTGHEHVDKIGYVAGAAHKQLMLNITCTEAGYGNRYVSAANISELPRENGSTQDAITIYVIDREDKMIRLSRLGSIITSKFEMRDYMVIPYADNVNI